MHNGVDAFVEVLLAGVESDGQGLCLGLVADFRYVRGFDGFILNHRLPPTRRASASVRSVTRVWLTLLMSEAKRNSATSTRAVGYMRTTSSSSSGRSTRWMYTPRKV